MGLEKEEKKRKGKKRKQRERLEKGFKINILGQ